MRFQKKVVTDTAKQIYKNAADTIPVFPANIIPAASFLFFILYVRYF